MMSGSIKFLLEEFNNMYAQTNTPAFYYYPDGTKGTSRPTDGQIFIEWQQGSAIPNRSWMWDDFKGQWIDVTVKGSSSSLSRSIPQYPAIPSDAELLEDFERLVAEGDNKCECGSEAAGSNKHSSWCPKHASQQF